jgi:hypothetical protein
MAENEKGTIMQSSENTSTTVVPGASQDAAPATDTGSPDMPNDENIIYPAGLRLVLILLALCCAVFLVALDQTIIATAIPKITDQFNSISDIGWYGSSYLLTATALQPTFGKLYRVFDVSLFSLLFSVYPYPNILVTLIDSEEMLFLTYFRASRSRQRF